MYMDAQGLFSESQAITTSAASTNYVDLQNTANRVGRPLSINVNVDTTFADGTSVTFLIQSDTAADFATALKTEHSSGAVLTANLAAGTVLELILPRNTQRYIRVYYTVSGTFTAGAVTTGFVESVQTAGYTAIAEQNALL